MIPLRGRCDDRDGTVGHVVVVHAAWHEGRACVLRVVRHLRMCKGVVSLARVLMRMSVVVVVVVIRMLICTKSQVSASVALSLRSRW